MRPVGRIDEIDLWIHLGQQVVLPDGTVYTATRSIPLRDVPGMPSGAYAWVDTQESWDDPPLRTGFRRAAEPSLATTRGALPGNWNHGSIYPRTTVLTAKGRAEAFRQKYGVEP